MFRSRGVHSLPAPQIPPVSALQRRNGRKVLSWNMIADRRLRRIELYKDYTGRAAEATCLDEDVEQTQRGIAVPMCRTCCSARRSSMLDSSWYGAV